MSERPDLERAGLAIGDMIHIPFAPRRKWWQRLLGIHPKPVPTVMRITAVSNSSLRVADDEEPQA